MSFHPAQRVYRPFIAALSIAGGIAATLYGIWVYPSPQSFVIDVGNNDDTSVHAKAWIEETTRARVTIEGETDYRTSFMVPLYSHFDLQHAITRDEKLTLSVRMRAEGSVYYRIGCGGCTGTGKPTPVTGLLYDARIDDYTLAQTFAEGHVYMRSDIVAEHPPVRSASLSTWLHNNAPAERALAIDDQDTILHGVDVSNTAVVADTSATAISSHIRGTTKLIVYLEDSIHATITKNDLNWYEGADTAILSLAPLQEPDRILGTGTIADDGITNAKRDVAPDVRGTLDIDGLQPGPYLLSITEANELQTGDFQVTHIEINTNKVMLTGTLVFLGGVDVYYNPEVLKNIVVLAWTARQAQTLFVDHAPFSMISSSDVNVWKTLELPQDSTVLSTQHALRMDVGSEYIALTPDGLFDPYIVHITSKNPDVILTNSSMMSEANGWVTVRKTIPFADAQENWGIASEQFQDIRRLDVGLFSQEMDIFGTQAKALLATDSLYAPVYRDSHGVIFARDNVRDLVQEYTETSLQEWLQNHVPARTDIGVVGTFPARLEPQSAYEARDDRLFDIDASLRGSVRLLVLANQAPSFSGTLTTSSTAHADVRILRLNDEAVVDSVTLDATSESDVEFTLGTETLAPGLYRIEIDCVAGECIMTDMRVRASSAVFLEEVETVGASSWYTMTDGEDIRFDVVDRGSTSVAINGTEYALNDAYGKITNSVSLNAGEHTLAFDSSVHMRAQTLAPSEDAFFFPYVYDFVSFDTQDYAMIYTSLPAISIDRIMVDIH